MAKKIDETSAANSVPVENPSKVVDIGTSAPTDYSTQPNETKDSDGNQVLADKIAEAIVKANQNTHEAKAKKVAKHEHGFTERDRREIALRKQSGDIDFIPANKASNVKDEYFKKQFQDLQIPKWERNHYHIAIEDRGFNAKTGARESFAHVQVFDKPTWNQIKNDETIKSKAIEILHDPTLESADAELVSYEYTKE